MVKLRIYFKLRFSLCIKPSSAPKEKILTFPGQKQYYLRLLHQKKKHKNKIRKCKISLTTKYNWMKEIHITRNLITDLKIH